MRTLTLLLTLALLAPAVTAQKRGSGEKTDTRPIVQIAILLDTSGSMQGLIDQAKSRLWRIVNEFIQARHNGRPPRLEVALFEYGKSSIPASENYLRMITPLTDDLDKVSEGLFQLRTNGGEEYCGAVIEAAVNGLQWSKSNDSFRAIFICGNEPFTQGPINWNSACQKSIQRGIIVNTIHCGEESKGIEGKWKAGALAADGTFSCINHDQKVAAIPTPHDNKLAQLGMDINGTYVPYGRHGKDGLARQQKQDSASQGLGGGNIAQRARSKGSRFYRNSDWDLIDALKDKKVELDKVPEKDLPEAMRKMTSVEKKAYIEKKKKERATIQKEIATLSKKRAEFIEKERRVTAEKEGKTLDQAILEAVRAQAAKRGFVWK